LLCKFLLIFFNIPEYKSTKTYYIHSKLQYSGLWCSRKVLLVTEEFVVANCNNSLLGKVLSGKFIIDSVNHCYWLHHCLIAGKHIKLYITQYNCTIIQWLLSECHDFSQLPWYGCCDHTIVSHLSCGCSSHTIVCIWLLQYWQQKYKVFCIFDAFWLLWCCSATIPLLQWSYISWDNFCCIATTIPFFAIIITLLIDCHIVAHN